MNEIYKKGDEVLKLTINQDSVQKHFVRMFFETDDARDLFRKSLRNIVCHHLDNNYLYGVDELGSQLTLAGMWLFHMHLLDHALKNAGYSPVKTRRCKVIHKQCNFFEGYAHE